MSYTKMFKYKNDEDFYPIKLDYDDTFDGVKDIDMKTVLKSDNIIKAIKEYIKTNDITPIMYSNDVEFVAKPRDFVGIYINLISSKINYLCKQLEELGYECYSEKTN